MSDIFDLFEIAEDPGGAELLRDLVLALEDVPAQDFRKAPDLTAVAVAIQALLEFTGHERAASAAQRWAAYEASGRKSSILEEARARAEAMYRRDLEAAEQGWEPLYLTKQSALPWRQPDEE